MEYICSKCGKKYPVTTLKYKCECGGLFHLSFEKKPLDFEKTSVSKENSLWKYIDALPFEKEDIWKEVTLSEGNTPLIRVDSNLYAKADYYMPTLSFKDRGAVMLVSLAKKTGAKEIVIDSSGNAATAVAAYSARVGIKAHIFVPDYTSLKKVAQIKAHDADIHLISGNRENTGREAMKMVEENGLFYASHIYNPIFWEGTKTYAYEVYEHFGHMPDAFIIPCGNGTLVMGVYIALQEMLDWGIIDRLPKILAVQAEGCSPVYQAYEKGLDSVPSCDNCGTVAEGIAIAAPARGREILKAIRKTNGTIITVTDEAVLEAREKLAQKGIYIEITSAANYAGYFELLKKDPCLKDMEVVFPLCGAGIKSN